jgi:hypothetical protein
VAYERDTEAEALPEVRDGMGRAPLVERGRRVDVPRLPLRRRGQDQ